jgi:hypothetical protein
MDDVFLHIVLPFAYSRRRARQVLGESTARTQVPPTCMGAVRSTEPGNTSPALIQALEVSLAPLQLAADEQARTFNLIMLLLILHCTSHSPIKSNGLGKDWPVQHFVTSMVNSQR